MLPLDLPRGAVRRDDSREQGARGGARRITAAVVGVILNLAVWFGLHVLFAEVREFAGFGMALDLPVLSTIDPAALALTLLAIVAVFHLKIGMIPVLAACSTAGVLYFLVVGAIA